jgi:hypothetical protein
VIHWQTASAQNRVLLIASSYGKGQGPFTSTIQTPLVTAGYTVRVWTQSNMGWPPLDTMLAYDAVFFHGSERTMAHTVDTTLTAFAEAGGRLVLEGTNLAQWSWVYWDFRKHAAHTKWRETNVTAYTYQVIDNTHMITAGLPATFASSGYYSATPPDYAEAWFGGRRLIAYQGSANSAAVIVYPRTVFFDGSLQRITTAANRDSLIVRSIRYVLTDPQDVGVLNIDYQLGHRADEDIPVYVKLRDWGSVAAQGTLTIEVSTDSTSWNNVASTPYLLAGFGIGDFTLTWHPTSAQRYYVRAQLVPDGADAQSDDNEVGMRVTTLVEALHPKLFFTAAEIPDLQARAATTHAQIAQAIASFTNQNLNLVLLPPDQWRQVNFPQLAAIVSISALQAVLNPTPTYLGFAKNMALGLCRYPMWETGNTNQDIYSARACQALALAYDWLYHDFNPAERDTVQIKLRIQLERLNAAGAQYIWWDVALIHNHDWNCMGYLGAGAFALMEEEPEAALWEQHAITNLNQRMQMYSNVADGSWYEAMNYWGFISWTTLPHIFLLREQMGLNYFDRPFFQHLADYRINGSLPDVSAMWIVNDGQPDEWYGPQEQLALVAHEYNDTHAQWLRSQIIQREGWALDGPFDFFWYDPNIPEAPPTALATLVPDQDTYIARSDWGPNAIFFAIKCGVPAGRQAYNSFWANNGPGRFSFSHFTPDQNAISLWYNNHYLIESSGVQSPFQFTKNSSTVLINGHGQIGDSLKGSWIDATNHLAYNPHLEESYGATKIDYVIGDATTAYQPSDGMRRFKRHVLYIRPSMFVILDDLKSQAPATFSFMLQHPLNIWTWDSSKVTMTYNSAQMVMRVLDPTPWNASASYRNYFDTDWGGWGLRVNNSVPDTSVKFLMAFCPTTGGQPTITKLANTANLTAIRCVDASGRETVAMFRHDVQDSAAVDSISSDAEIVVVNRQVAGNVLKWFSVKAAQFVRWGTDYPLRFSSPGTTDFEWEYRADTLDTHGAMIDGIRIWAPAANLVLYDGYSVPFTRDGDYVIIHSEDRLPRPITDVTIVSSGDDVQLRWTRVNQDIFGDPIAVDGYDVYRILSDGSSQLCGSVPAWDSTYTDQPVLSGEAVFYDVRARTGSAISPAKQTEKPASSAAKAAGRRKAPQ